MLASHEDDAFVVRMWWEALLRNFNPETPMHLSLSFPHPLARLTGLLVALEQARSGAAAREKDLGKNLNKTLGQADEINSELLADHHDDLESLSLSRYGESLEPGSHDLDAMSLGRVEEAPTGRDAGLSDASLSRDIPRRPRR
jgi:hypothetical protein